MNGKQRISEEGREVEFSEKFITSLSKIFFEE